MASETRADDSRVDGDADQVRASKQVDPQTLYGSAATKTRRRVEQSSSPHDQPEVPILISECSGDKKAVLVGCDYEGGKHWPELAVPISDTFHLRIDLDLMRGYPMRSIRIYTDVESSRKRRPTKRNLQRAMKWLVEDAKEDDALFFYFAGHGDRDSDGASYICTSDGEKIEAVELRQAMVDSLPPGCLLTAVFDCCHTGNILNLRYIYESVSDLENDDPIVDGQRTHAEVICWTPCAVDETASDGPGFSKGYLSNALVHLDDDETEGAKTYAQAFQVIKDALPKMQTPQLSSSRRLKPDEELIM